MTSLATLDAGYLSAPQALQSAEAAEEAAQHSRANPTKFWPPVKRVDNITSKPTITRDLALIKVAASAAERAHVMQLVEVYRARVVDVSPESLVIETTGTEDKIDSLIDVLRPTA